ncbi:COG3650 family protein [Paracoccus jeotgali]|uniref:COG3650 family protein n=1 Tax=Paracoccus jeotgali TaxID=2065379 RepID=UPI0028A7B041|nr:hypothetical protein [Paracoccus jeotgali]
MKFRLVFALLPLALAACDEQAMQDFRFPWDKPLEAAPPAEPVDPMKTPLVTPAVSPRDVPIEVEGERKPAVNAETTTLNTTAFVARGNEPFWRVDVAGTTANYQTPDNQKGRAISVRRLVYAKGVEYVGTLNGSAFAVNIRSAACVDSMSGEKFPMTATLRVGGKSLTGCASPAAEARTASPAATPAAKPEAKPAAAAQG